jgi:demethoxyubiquinone hydroxylase (CLK1/Coq7/Cat5 family)
MRGSLDDVWTVIDGQRDKLANLDKRTAMLEADVKTVKEIHLADVCEQLRKTDERLTQNLGSFRLEVMQRLELLLNEHYMAQGRKGLARYLPSLINTLISITVGALAVYAALK